MTGAKKPSGKLLRFEPYNLQWIDEFPISIEMMRNAGWFPFCEIMQGHNVQVTLIFVKNYKYLVVNFESLMIKVDERNILDVL